MLAVRDSWKKKFFEEKKKTMPLEEICRRLQNELNRSVVVQHREKISNFEFTHPLRRSDFHWR